MPTRPAKAVKGSEAARPEQPAHRRPSPLRVAAIALAVEALGLCVAAAFAVVSTVEGQSYQRSSGVALTLIALGTAAVLCLLAMGVARARPWSRTPAVMIQAFVGGAAIYLMDGHRYEWGVPALLVAAICLAAIFAPSSLRALNRPPRPPAP
jgi:peptidoglycan/LPS O-acetylase OafA/YrhL